MATRYDGFTARQGDTFVTEIKWKDDAGEPVTGLDGYEFEFSLAPAPSSRPFFQYLSPDFISLNVAEATWRIEIPFFETRKWPPRRLAYEMSYTSPDGIRGTLMFGLIPVAPEVVKGEGQYIVPEFVEPLLNKFVTDRSLRIWTESGAYERVSASHDADLVLTTANVVWPDGSDGVLTVTDKNESQFTVDGYTITHVDSGKTVTQALVTRDSNGLVTSKPLLTVSS